MSERVVNFPSNVPYGTTHFEHGRTWEYVAPGMWKSTGADGKDIEIDWDDIDNKPTQYPPSVHQQDWSTITGKPSEYPPESHGHQISDVDGLQDALDNAGGTPSWNDITGKPSDFPPADHNHDGEYLKTETDPTVPDHVKSITTDDIDNWNASSGAASTWDELTGKPTEFPPEAHNQDWSTITNTPSEYPPEDHTHSQGEVDGLELRLEAIEDSITSGGGFVDAPNDGKLYGRQSEAWEEVVIPAAADPDWSDIQNKPSEYPPEAHNHVVADITDFDPADYQPVGDYLSEAPEDGKQYARKDAGWSEVQATGGGSSLWEQNGDDIYYSDGNVGIGTDDPQADLHVDGEVLVKTDDGASATINVESSSAQAAVNLKSPFGGYKITTESSDQGEAFRFAILDRTDGFKHRLVIDSGGNVGIGTNDPDEVLEVRGDIKTNTAGGAGVLHFGETSDVCKITGRDSSHASKANTLDFFTNGGSPDMTLDANGNLGIGMSPEVRTAKEQLAEWKASFDARLKAEPKADNKAVTLEITDDAFEVLPTEEALAEWMETRAAGDKLQVNGNISATGTVKVDNTQSASRMLVLNATTSATSAYRQAFAVQNSGTDMLSCTTGPVVTLDTGPNQFKLSNAAGSLDLDNSGNATFSGTVNADLYTTAHSAFGTFYSNVSGNNGAGFAPVGKQTHGVFVNGVGTVFSPSLDDTLDLGAAGAKWKDGWFSGTVNADNMVLSTAKIRRSDSNGSGLYFLGAMIRPIDKDGAETNGALSLGSDTAKFKDAHFSDTVRAGAFASPNNGYGVTINSSGQISPCIDIDNLIFDQGSVTHTIGTNRNGGKFKDGWFSGTVNANKFVGDGSGLTGVGGGFKKESVPINNGNMINLMNVTSSDTNGINIGGASSTCYVSTNLGDGKGPELQFGHYYSDPVNGPYVNCKRRDGSPGVNLGISVDKWRNGYFSDNIYAGNVSFRNSYAVTLTDLIDAFQTLRSATSNERDADGIRTAISDCVGGLIQKWEAMQSEFDAEVEAEEAKIDKTIDPDWEKRNL
jgi:hypothetical protein